MCTSSIKRTFQFVSLTIQETATETYAWNNLGLAFFSPLCYLGIDLVPKLRFDFTGIAGEEREETLSSAVDNVDFVQRYGMYNFFSLLDFTLWTLDKFGLINLESRMI